MRYLTEIFKYEGPRFRPSFNFSEYFMLTCIHLPRLYYFKNASYLVYENSKNRKLYTFFFMKLALSSNCLTEKNVVILTG